MSARTPTSEPVIARLTVVPRERRPMVSVEFTNRPAAPLEYQGHVVLQPHIVVIKPRSHRAYRVVTQEDAQWMFQVIDEILNPRQSRSWPSAPATDASAAASSTSPAAASAKRPHRTRQS